ncbi:Osmotically inducible lipoprotein OsmB [Georgfuchsia toluolica]|uniref:Osmotically inducible lipoprotein OsmB n=1 Tax=Georgfuchsia toluolica TaxID=424218 RepID=A0A916J6H7_9PROT|nr:glycine zipper domain-containing protein [Georgfuchsia toluolica]CAG4884338.1 Osmotically inducible lipoprotein OsmB [Georgfuchsia toluolica]
MKTLASIGLIALLPLLAAPYTNLSKENIGTVTGALIGGATGAALTGIYPGVIGGAVVGAYFGNRIGGDFDFQPPTADR